MKASKKDNTTQIIHYKEFTKDINYLIMNNEKLKMCNYSSFCVVIYPEIQKFKEISFRKALIADNNVEPTINKYITIKQITFREETVHTEEVNEKELGI
jgi:hypothetical protein